MELDLKFFNLKKYAKIKIEKNGFNPTPKKTSPRKCKNRN
jgi:hypothetical protein